MSPLVQIHHPHPLAEADVHAFTNRDRVRDSGYVFLENGDGV